MSAKYAIISEQGRRSHMEDEYFFDQNFDNLGQIFGGIYDGHCGGIASKYVASNLHRIFLEFIQSGFTPREAFIQSYQKISAELARQDSGACVVNFLIKDGLIFFANVGDARIIIIGKDNFKQLTVDHRLDNEAERKRIVEMGGKIEHPHSPYVYRGSRGLMPTRTLGDEYFKPIGIIATPDVGVYEISDQDVFLIAACDGLFDVMSNKEIVEFSRRFNKPENLVEALKNEVLMKRMGHDNLTMMILSLAD